MRLGVAMMCGLALAAALLLSGCPRDIAPGSAPAAGTATHPWELQGWKSPVAPSGQAGAGTAGVVELPPDIGPHLSTQDTLDEDKLPGVWLQVCHVWSERVNIVPPSEMDEMELHEGGGAIYRAVTDNKLAVYTGDWKKTQPGRLSVVVEGGKNVEYYAVLFRGEFLYLWNQEARTADWFARVPPVFSDRIKANRFNTTLGDLFIKSTVGASFEGSVKAQGATMSIAGYYQSGVIALRWEDHYHNSAGFAVFHVDQDWNTLYGAWWLGDFDSAPFGGTWDGARAQDTAGAAAEATGTTPDANGAGGAQ